MSSLILPDQSVVQPPEGLGIEWENPLNVGLGGLFDTRAGIELVYSNRASNYTALRRAARAGVAADFSSTANQQYAHRPGYATTGAMTIFVLMEVRALTNYSAVIAKQQTTTVNVPFEFRLGSTSATGSDFNFVRASASSGANSKQTTGSRLSAAPGVPRAIAITVADGLLGTIPIAYVDRVKTSFNANSTAGSCTDSGQPVWVGRRYDGATQLDGRIYFVALWSRALSEAEIGSLTHNPWQLFRHVQHPLFFGVGAGGGAGNATGSLAAITLTAASGSGSGAASAASAPSAISLTPPLGAASAGVTGFASGALAAVSLSAPAASAVGSASATGSPAGASLSAPQASAQGAASASGTLDGIDLSAPTANATAGATGFASGAVAPISLSAAAGSASGSAIASAAYAGITLTAPSASASAGQAGFAVGSLAPVNTTAPQGSATGAAAAFAAYTGITLTPAQGTASATSPVGNAAGELRAISLTAATATANGGFPPLTNEEMRELLDTVRLLKIQLQQVNGYTSLIPALL